MKKNLNGLLWFSSHEPLQRGGGWLVMPLSSLSSLSLNYSALDIIIFIFLVQITHLSISSLAIISPISLLITLVKLVRFVNIMSVSGTNQLGFLPSQPLSSDFFPQITSIIMQFPSVLFLLMFYPNTRSDTTSITTSVSVHGNGTKCSVLFSPLLLMSSLNDLIWLHHN